MAVALGAALLRRGGSTFVLPALGALNDSRTSSWLSLSDACFPSSALHRTASLSTAARQPLLSSRRLWPTSSTFATEHLPSSFGRQRFAYSTDAAPDVAPAAPAAPAAEKKTAAAKKQAKKSEKAAQKESKKKKSGKDAANKPKKPQRMQFIKPQTPPGLPRRLSYELPPKIRVEHTICDPAWAADLNERLQLRYPVRALPAELLTPSGFSKPMGPQPSLPFAVVRSQSNNVPVYRKIKNGNTRIFTIVRHCRGDVTALLAELRKVVDDAAAQKYAHKKAVVRPEIFHRVGGVVHVNGDYLKPIVRWLKGLGF